MHLAEFPRDVRSRADRRRCSIARWARLSRDPRRGQPRARGRAAGQDDRHLAGGARRADGRRRDAALLRALRRRPADAVHRLAGRARDRRGTGGLEVSVSRAEGDEVRALLARRARRSRATGSRGLCDRCVDALGGRHADWRRDDAGMSDAVRQVRRPSRRCPLSRDRAVAATSRPMELVAIGARRRRSISSPKVIVRQTIAALASADPDHRRASSTSRTCRTRARRSGC